MPVRMKVTPPDATSARAGRPLGALPPAGGPFERTIGNTRAPPSRSAPVGAIVTVLTTRRRPALGQRREAFDARVDQLFRNHAEREPQVPGAAAVGIEKRARDDGHPLVGGAARDFGGVARKLEPGEETAARPRPGDALGHRPLERGEQRPAPALVERPRTLELLVEPAAARVLLEELLPERTRALVGVLLRGD